MDKKWKDVQYNVFNGQKLNYKWHMLVTVACTPSKSHSCQYLINLLNLFMNFDHERHEAHEEQNKDML